MTAYLLVFPQDISGWDDMDPTTVDPYDSEIEAIMARFGGRYLRIREQPLEILEGDWQPPLGMGIVEFPSMEQARAFWASPEYVPLKAYRMERGRFNILLVDGMPAGATLREIELDQVEQARLAGQGLSDANRTSME